jgi:hypothetical protein
MERFGEAKEGLFRQILRLEHGVPSHDTFGRLFQALDPRNNLFQCPFHAPGSQLRCGNPVGAT